MGTSKMVVRPEEEWRVVPEDSNVKISSLGRVKRGRRIIKLGHDKDGYIRVTIKGKTIRLHRLVAQLFIPNPNNLPVVDHINNVKDDNRVENLRWCTSQENSKYAADMGLQTRLKNDDSITIVIDENNNGYGFKTVVSAADYIGVDPPVVHLLITGKRKTAKGYRALKLSKLTMMENKND